VNWQIDSLTWRWKLVALVLGAACFAFGQGRWPIPLAAWLAPILLIAYVRSVRAWVGILGFTIAHAVAWEVAYLGMVKMPMFARWGLFTGLSLVLGLVFLADRWAARRSAGFWTTLVFPCGWVAFEFLNGRFSPNGSWGSLAYTFTDQSSFVQVASVSGWTGITFLVGWVASVVHWVWQRRALGQTAWRQAGICAGVMVAVLVFGSVRLWMQPTGETTRVASIVGPSSFLDGGEFRRDVWAYTRGIDLPQDQVESARLHIRSTMESHLLLAERELRAGARIVSFPEANPALTKREEAEFVAAAAELADEFDAYVGLGLFVFRPEAGLPTENKYVLLGPDGSVVWDFLKANLVPGSSHVVGDGILPDVETNFGRLSCAICFDMDFPALLSQSGGNGTDIFLAPSNDWTEVRALHANMARMRAIEQGFNLVRPTKDGFAIVTDPLGRILAKQDTDRPGNHVMIADVPTSGVSTLYAIVGDSFAWACIAGFLVLLGSARVARLD
jgi:apolipoprotein N-acyltransferase